MPPPGCYHLEGSGRSVHQWPEFRAAEDVPWTPGGGSWRWHPGGYWRRRRLEKTPTGKHKPGKSTARAPGPMAFSAWEAMRTPHTDRQRDCRVKCGHQARVGWARKGGCVGGIPEETLVGSGHWAGKWWAGQLRMCQAHTSG
jgi:hypothetical protein